MYGSLEGLEKERKKVKARFNKKHQWFMRWIYKEGDEKLVDKKQTTSSSTAVTDSNIDDRFAVLKTGAGKVVVYAALM